eukprot:s4373_g6.t1
MSTGQHKLPWWSRVMKGPSNITIYDENDPEKEGGDMDVGVEIIAVKEGTRAQQLRGPDLSSEQTSTKLLQPTPKIRSNPKRKALWGAKARWQSSRKLRNRRSSHGRKDLPKSALARATGSKPSLARAVDLAKQASLAKNIIRRVENDFYSNSSRNAKDAKRRAVRNVLEAAFEHPYPLTPDKMKLLAGAFREAGYKSADTYLVEAKTEHIERWGEWSALLDRHFKLCIKAVKRGQGPRKKAPEVPREVWTSYDLLATDLEGTKVKLAPQLFAFGVLFMMREIEIANLTIADVKLSQSDRLVKVTWTESKMDQEGLSLSRTLQCICQAGCDISCPYAVSEVLVNAAMLRGSDGAISVDVDGHTASKADLVRDWKRLFNIPVTGHSTRRSGALQYIRLGWSIPQVGFLGRWKSNVILSYAEEALETMAVNTPGKFGAPPEGPQKDSQGMLKDLLTKAKAPRDVDLGQEAIVAQIKADILALKKGTKVMNDESQDSVELLKQKIEAGHKYLPKFVTSTRYKVTHINHRVLLYAPAAQWRTLCGWHYYNAGYQFEGDEGTSVSCTKCLGIAQSKEAVTSLSLDIISFTALLSAARTSWARAPWFKDMRGFLAGNAGRIGSFASAQAAVLLSKVRSVSLRPDMGCCHAFALALDTGRCWLQAVLLLEWMWSSAVLANQVIFTSLLSASNKCQQWQTSLNLHASISSTMVSSDTVIYEAAAGAWPLALGWKRVDASAGNAALPFLRWQSVLEFGGEEPIPAIKVLLHMDEVFFFSADDSKLGGDDAMEQKDWRSAIQHYTAGIDMLKRTNDRLNEGFRSRACLLLTQRGTAHLQLKEPKAALRDAVAAMDLEHSAAEAQISSPELLHFNYFFVRSQEVLPWWKETCMQPEDEIFDQIQPVSKRERIRLRVGPDIDKADRQLEELGMALKDLDESFTRSSGPGGQNVNKAENFQKQNYE